MPTYIYKDDQQQGPYDDEYIEMCLNKGKLSYDDHCWKEGWEEWKPLSAAFTRPTPPPPPKASSATPKITTQPSPTPAAQTDKTESLKSFKEGIGTKRKAYIIVCLILGIPLAIVIASGNSDVANGLMAILAIPMLIFWWKCYKCPSCKKYMNILGGGGFPMKAPKSCKKCGAGNA